MADETSILMKDKYLALFVLLILVGVITLFRLWGTEATLAGVGFMENLTLIIAGTFAALLKQTAPPSMEVKSSSDTTNVTQK